MSPELVTLDIETENTSHDINDNKRIISVQMLVQDKPLLYYDGAPMMNLHSAVEKLKSMIANRDSFVGFNVRNFDAPLIDRFLAVQIPSTQIIEITELPAMDFIRTSVRKPRPRLEEACNCLEIDCRHKEIINNRALKLKQDATVRKRAEEGAAILKRERGWTHDFCCQFALDKVCGGMAILDTFNEFVANGGNENSDFYKYAIGDVRVENALYNRLKEMK